MRYMSLKDIKLNMVLAYGIYDAQNKCIAQKGDHIDNRIQYYLEDNGYRGAYIDDKITDDIKVNPFIKPKQRGVMMRDIYFCHLAECKKHA